MDTINKLKEAMTSAEIEHCQQVSQCKESLKQLSDEREGAEARVEAIREALHSAQEDREILSEKYDHQLDEVCRTAKTTYLCAAFPASAVFPASAAFLS